MTSINSRIPALITYLVAQFAGAATLGLATPPVNVYDGPAVSEDPAPLALHVGLSDAFSDAISASADSQQTAVGLLTKREELITVHCCAVAWAGTDDMATVRTSAFGIVAAVEDLVRFDATLQAQAGAALARPGATGMVLQQNVTQQGGVAQVSFQLVYKALIGV